MGQKGQKYGLREAARVSDQRGREFEARPHHALEVHGARYSPVGISVIPFVKWE